jgi:DNA sulfur modification protein DndD
MKLERITLEDFRQYYGRQRLTFSKDSEQNVTVIHGVNGAGKTSLFLALNWCLYGEGVENVGELISKEAISHAQEGDVVGASVELTFTHNGERYLVSRSLEGVREETGSVSVKEQSDFTMMRTRWDGQAERVNNPIGTMNAILPSNVRTYFLFDGEKIDNFAKPEASDEVRYAIYNVLKLEVMTRARRHLSDVAAEFRRRLKNISSGELRELLERDENARTKKEEALEEIDEIEREIQSARRKIEDIDQRLREEQASRTLQKQRERLERDLQQRRAEIDNVVRKTREALAGGYLIMGLPAANKALSTLDKKRERGEIPSSIRQQFVQDLIDQTHCICGRSFELGGPEHKELLSLMERSMPGSLEDDILELSATLKTFPTQSQELKDALDEAMHQRTRLVRLVQSLEEELDDLSRQLGGSPQEEISRLEQRRKDFRADIDSYLLKKGNLENCIESKDEEIEDLEKQIEKARKERRKEHLLTTKSQLAQRAADAIDEMYQTFADDMRRRIEGKTKEIFKLLIWKDSHFQDVSLGTDYKLEVIDRYDLPARPELSAGERQVLSLSFITAMSRISEEEAPLVMDTPFGRLSSNHRNSITENLPELADQLVLFVTDEELRGQARRNLESSIGAEYRLKFDRETSCTEILEVS